ncbi:unnamed protein product [Zymoseptoria tritici ST99CH_1A5]|uniref:Zn(2)-C6 fungal-type domain-containing protein n=2 Tax=Zymoseptoria tritici TaxID=1047171 RepID=A0A2H1FYP6_ZYMTR|nr:unnamed protein product [Zymoseptoria tritici ST99CH_1E4]SMR47684.1 unnamed protein product [Zymoseptoria tritici ST99CH_3D1]SMY21588.1 unnamed protein product [Zymoseptoria tritici ST99CH_1A5]
MSAAPSRRRACEPCHVLKIKCDRTQEGCGRCIRLGINCAPAVRRLQRNRITELESQIENLTKALHQQARISKLKERQPQSDEIVTFLDTRMTETSQRDALRVYSVSVVPRLPIVPVDAADYAELRRNKPILLLTVLAFATPNVLDDAVRNELVEKAMESLGLDLIGTGNVSIPHVQAALLACFWYRSTPKSAGHSTVEQLAQLATSVSIAMGLAGPGSAKFSITAIPDPDVLLRDGPRTWLGCFIATTAMALTTRRQDANVWTPYHEECLGYLQISPLATDRIFCLLVTITRLHFRTALSLGLHDASPMSIISDSAHRKQVSDLKAEIANWSAVALTAGSLELMFWHQIALVHLNEPVLYTPTNKSTFSAPYLPHQLAPEDFAAPLIVTDAHVAALHDLKDACHRALDIALDLGTAVILSLDSMSFIPRILFTLLVLLKLYISVSGPGNTYSEAIDRSDLQVEYYLARMGVLSSELQAGDGASWNAMIISATNLLEQWFLTYNVDLQTINSARTESSANELTPPSGDDNLDVSTTASWDSGQWGQLDDVAWLVPLPAEDSLLPAGHW